MIQEVSYLMGNIESPLEERCVLWLKELKRQLGEDAKARRMPIENESSN
jgi:hypothetical protein